MSFNISQLFTPAQSGVTAASVTTTPASGTWYSTLLNFASTLGLDVTAWQPGGVARTILAVTANALAQSDAVVSTMAQGGFLDFAATGTITTTALNGTTTTSPVSPDPSIPSQNPTGFTTWLDVLADSVYNVQRIQGTYASGTLSIVNTSNIGCGPYLPGTYHVANTTSGATYSNTQSLTITASTANPLLNVNPSTNTVTTTNAHGFSVGQVVYFSGVGGVSGINGKFFVVSSIVNATNFVFTGTISGGPSSNGTVYTTLSAPFQADNLGTGGTSTGTTGGTTAPGISQAVTTNIGVSVGNVGNFVGSNYESNTALAARCRLKLQSLSPNGPRGAYQYFALTASQILAAQAIPVTLDGGPITRAIVSANPSTGVVTTTIANNPTGSFSNGANVVEGVTQVAVTGATNASPIQITVGSTTGLSNGDFVTVSGVLGNTAANGTWTIASLTGTTFTLVGSSGNGTYTSSTGSIEGGDLGQVDNLIQANVVPTAVTAVTQSATAFNVTIAATVVVPAAQVSAYTTAATLAITNYFNSLPIGGVTPPGGSNGVLQFSDVSGVLYGAGSTNGSISYVQSVSMTLNSGSVSLNYPSTISLAIPTLSLTVQGV